MARTLKFEAGRAFAGQEGERPLDLFFDYRETIEDIKMPESMINPYTITIKSLRQAAQDFSAKAPKARFALLRLWSAPHFYPFMMGLNNRDLTIFRDGIGRMWVWKFMCKDMAYSEYSVHKNMTARLEQMQRQLGSDSHKFQVRKDVVLVMGRDEDELLKLAAAATFSVQTQPWRLEIDFWKSFVNVDVKFLDGLQDEWWA
ncbi:hypothetical protein LTR84_010608 [Exophiala bonariae]|uniref:Uncharacterized protein n=1 Tax=Exophiala bonariae TaxID=1690606 RepID=A0AAV9MT62_9EURO|nr:hypothetical protein LTR84_010608 [Exophiala bonariae]